MNYKKIVILFVSGFLFMPVFAVYAATPALSLTNNGDGNNVQLVVNGDPSVSVILYYTKVGAGAQISSVGNTSSGGYFSTAISTSSYQIVPSSSVYVTTNGISGPSSNSVIWPISTSNSSLTTISLSQTGVVLSAGQSATITSTGAGSLYLSNNSNPQIANVNVNGSAVTILANANGSTVSTVCSTSNTSSCASIYVTVQNAGVQALTFGQNNVTIVSGQNVPISVSGGTGVYMVQNNPNSSIVQTSISGSTITLSTTASSGFSSITVCSTNMSSCGIINVTVGTASSSIISFNPSNPTVSVGLGTTVTISGSSGGVYYISSNSNPSIAQVTLSSSTLTVVGNTIGSSVVTVCSSLGGCGSLTITVNYVASGGTISLSQSSLTLLTGQTLSVVISGGASPYSIINPLQNIAQTSLNGNILAVYGASVGSDSLNVCSAEGGCVSLSVLVNGSGVNNSQLVLSQNNLSLTSGQNTTISISGNGSYYISSNLNSSVASAQINGSSAVITAITAGTDTISICQSNGQCVNLLVTVSAVVSPFNPPATPPATTFSRYLFSGVNGEDVLQLQKILSAKGFLSATPNGHYGPATVAGVKKLQKANGLSQLGTVGPSTRSILNQILNSTPNASSAAIREQQMATIQQQIQQLMAQIAQIQGQ
ncbi:MAG: peptidoglycan-binding protein [Candidatus Staskawiczbacteria bacterium]|nr:peptidoglycan-binding protein [Candidatus Staskawiczbacteria bacterium]